MSALQEQLLDAVSMLANSAVNNSNATITLECKIIEIIDPAIGLYKVEYLGNQFEVYSNPNTLYSINDIVYVLVPDGDLTKTKTIVGSVSPSASIYVDIEATDHYVPISNNLFTHIDDIELCTYHSESFNLTLDTVGFNMIFQDYLENYNTFLFTAKIKTNIALEQQQSGNYGVILNLPFLKVSTDGVQTEQIWKSVSIDVNTIQGNPYRLDEYSLQNIYFEVEPNTIYDNTREPFITAFVQDFAQDSSISNIDIWIKDLALKTIDILTEEDKQGYSLSLVASEGNYFLNDKYDTTKILTPILKINGKNTNVNGYECYWFVEDTSITTTSDGYLSIGGLGWKCLNKRTNSYYNEDGKLIYEYTTNMYKLSVLQTDVLYSLRYKCVLVKNGIVVGGSLRLKNLNSAIEIELFSKTGSTTFVKDVGYVNLIARIYYPGVSDNPDAPVTIETAWQRFDKNNNYLDNNFYEFVRVNDPIEEDGKVWLETEIQYPCYKLEDINTINCTFYGIASNTGYIVRNNLGTSSLMVSAEGGFTYKLSVQNGDVLYKYDADGDSPRLADYDGPVSSKVTEIKPITFTIYKSNGTELNEIEYLYCRTQWRIPKNSMIKLKTAFTSEDENYYYVEGQGQVNINYDIVNSYNVKKNDNSILLTVLFDDNILTEVINIKFLKDGESGTNGSKYSAVILYNGYGYNEKDINDKIQKLQCVNAVDAWGLLDCSNGEFVPWPDEDPKLNVAVYCNGELLTNGYTIAWSMFDSATTDPDFSVVGGSIHPRRNTFNENSISIVEAQITVGNLGVTNSQEVIYAYYPIEATYLPIRSYSSGLIPSLEGGFDKVLYAADGTNPKYDNTNPFHYIDNLDEADATPYYIYNWSAIGNLTIQNQDNDYCTVRPFTKFDNGITRNAIKINITITEHGKDEVNDNIAILNNKVTQLENEITYNQQLMQHILDFSTIFDYNNYILELNSFKDLLKYRSELIIYVNQMINALDDIKNYCDSKNILSTDFDFNSFYDDVILKIQILKNNLYGLGYYTEFLDLNRLSGYQLNISDPDSFKLKYGISIYEVLNSLIESYNNILVKKYWVAFDILTAEDASHNYIYQQQLDDLNDFETDLIQIKDNEDLLWLQSSFRGFGPEQEFVNLRNQIIAIILQLFDQDKDCYSYDSIKTDILQELQKIFVKYQDEYYSTYYTNKIALLRQKLKEEKANLSDYNKIVLDEVDGSIIHIKPIIMLFNRYELSNINGWDGSKLYIDENNEEYLLAPQIGAGLKKNGLFTGVVLGIKQFNSSVNQQIGMFGYSDGIQSYFMNAEDGSVIFGKPGTGQIIADPTQSKALLYSSNFFKNYGNDGKPQSYGTSNWNKQGLLIDLTTPEIRFGNGNFSVDENGHISASGGGTIAGWEIDDTKIYSNISAINGRITLDSGATVTGTDEKGNKIYEYSAGKIYSHTHDTLTATNKGFYISADGLSFGSSIRISSDEDGSIQIGRLTGSRYWTISGNGSNSRISYGTSSFNSGSNSVYIGTDGISLSTNKFYVKSNGELYSTSGSIGGWNISSNKLSSGNIEFNQNGSIRHTGGSWSINQDGTATFNNIYANSTGNIGGWAIGSTGLTSPGGSIGLYSSGSIVGPQFTLDSAGLALTGGNISFGGATLTGAGFNMSSGTTTVNNVGITTYVNTLIANKIKATFIDADFATSKGISCGWLGASGQVSASKFLCGGHTWSGAIASVVIDGMRLKVLIES